MSRALSFNEFAEIVNHISRYNSFGHERAGNFPSVKYIDPVFDMRTRDVFSVRFRGIGAEKQFGSTNAERDLPDTMYKRIMDWLTTEKD